MKTSWLTRTLLTATLPFFLQAGPVSAANGGSLPLQGLLSSSGSSHAHAETAHFSLVPNNVGQTNFENCFAAHPGDAAHRPTADVTVLKDVPGGPNDLMLVELHNFKPHVNFDLFTVEHSRFLASGQPDPQF